MTVNSCRRLRPTERSARSSLIACAELKRNQTYLVNGGSASPKTMQKRRRKYQAAKPLSVQRRYEDNAFHRFARKSGFNVVTKRWQNNSRQLCGFALRKRPCGDQGFQVRDLQVACRFNASHFTLHNFNPLNEILHCFSRKSLPLSNFDALACSVSAQTLAPIRRLPLNEPLEKYNNPPAPPRKIETSPRMVSQYGVFTSYQANVDANGNNILGDAANEPSISVDPTDGNKMTIGWRQFNSITSDFRQAGWGYTTDAGVHWTFPGVLENNIFRSDPVTNSDETGNFFYLSLQSDQAQSFFCDDVWRSINGGQTWTEQSPDEAGHGGDKEWFTIDKTNGHGAWIPISVLDRLLRLRLRRIQPFHRRRSHLESSD